MSPAYIRHASAIGAVSWLLACGADPTVGVCNVTYLDPLISIVSVSDESTAQQLPTVAIRNIEINGHTVTDLRTVVEVGSFVHGVSIQGDELRCAVVCGFGVLEGSYGLTFASQGYRDTTIVQTFRYERSVAKPGGCPTTVSDGDSLRVILTPS